MLSKNKIKYIRSLAQKKQRTADGVFVAEGKKLVADLLPCFKARYIAATEQWFSENHQFSSFFPVDYDIITNEELCRISAQETPQLVLAVFEQQKDDTPLSAGFLSDRRILCPGHQPGPVLRSVFFLRSDQLCGTLLGTWHGTGHIDGQYPAA